MSELRELYQEVILDHGKRPRNFREQNDEADCAHGHNPLCGDRITVYVSTDGETIAWNNPESGNYGNVTPVRDGTSGSGLYCREFQQVITVGGQTETAYGTACQQPDGTWRIVE